MSSAAPDRLEMCIPAFHILTSEPKEASLSPPPHLMLWVLLRDLGLRELFVSDILEWQVWQHPLRLG